MRRLLWAFLAITLVLMPAVVSAQVVISQVYAGGGSYSSTYKHDFVELFNRGTTYVNVTGWTVSFKQYDFELWSDTSLFGMIPPGGYFLVKLDGSSVSGTYALPPADATGWTNLASSGTVALFDSEGYAADWVGYGISPPFSEGTQIFSSLYQSDAALRKGGGCVDTNNNYLDFDILGPYPYNSSVTPQPCTVSTNPGIVAIVDPTTIAAGGSVLFLAQVFPGQNPASTGLAVGANLTDIGGASLAYFYDDGTHGDGVAGDLIFSLFTQVTAGTQPGVKSIPVAVADGQQRGDSTWVQLEVTAPRRPSMDFDGDGKSDVLWHHATRGEVWLWTMNGPTKAAESYVRTVGEPGWAIRSLGDQNGDGHADILWRHAPTGMLYLWTMSGSTVLSETYIATIDPAYDIVATGDYNGDGKSDILWRHTANGELWVWLMNGAAPQAVSYLDTIDPGYVVAGSGDLNGDRKADIVWRGATSGDVWVWLMNGAARVSETYVATVSDLGYQIVALADQTGDGKADVLWRHATRGEVWLWPMNGQAYTAEQYVDAVSDTGYRIVGTGDYDGDGKADILWHHNTRGEVWTWLMDGAVKLSETWAGSVPEVAYQILKLK
jgi:hypothetical protein